MDKYEKDEIELKKLIKQVREELKMTQTQVAEKLGISQNAYSYIEYVPKEGVSKKGSELKLKTIMKLSEIFKIDIIERYSKINKVEVSDKKKTQIAMAMDSNTEAINTLSKKFDMLMNYIIENEKKK